MPRFSLVLLALLLAACGSTRPDADASVDEDGPSRVEMRLDSLTSRLELSEDQRTSIHRALTQEAADIRAARGLPDLQSRRDAMHRARAEAASRIAASLTRGQREAYAALRSEQEIGYDPSVERQLSRMRTRLELTDGQETTIASLLEQQVVEIEALVSEYRRIGGRDVDDVRYDIKTIRERYDGLILDELTAEQAESFERLLRDQQRPRPRTRQGRG